jgi:pSer/pThr/pTyr-binding forkhead associated (FHA) protein
MDVQLLVVQGRPRGKCLKFPPGEFVFGRGPECHVRPDPEGQAISRQHCLLRVSAEGVHIRDLGSTNGTLVNGTRVLEERPLRDGDLVQLGAVVLQLRYSPRPPQQDTVEAGLPSTGKPPGTPAAKAEAARAEPAPHPA